MERQWSVSRSSMIFGHATYIIHRLCIDINPKSSYWPPLWARMPVTILLPPPKYMSLEWQQDLWGSASFTATKCLVSYLNSLLNSQSYQYDRVWNFTTIHAMSHRSYFCRACSSRVNISAPAFYSTIM